MEISFAGNFRVGIFQLRVAGILFGQRRRDLELPFSAAHRVQAVADVVEEALVGRLGAGLVGEQVGDVFAVDRRVKVDAGEVGDRGE